ncbi:SirB1 family protein [Arenimonas fontis]|uniref:Tetratricopeptide repeat protein n=1 Tax=Arenimonas fontis TaxID=2608255 RepID=A0A5B2ZB65_9GAMM|nr:tetratricopeptide repeat protein [Arenimonas fontis]KAA2284391.1 tetratricopeptide repeat protein [Arenimonas fontis]
MASHRPLPDWNALARLGDDELPLLDIALLIARDEYPGLDAAAYAAQLAAWAETLRLRVDAAADLPTRLTEVNRYLFEELGFAGNTNDYDDPRNSYLNEVVDRKLGIPISLALVQMEVTRRLGLPLQGVSFPGHFLVRLPVDDGILVLDPFNKGRPVSAEELRVRAVPHLGGQAPDDGMLLKILAPASNRVMLVRMLRNLKGLYRDRGDWERVARCADRLLKLAPDLAEAWRDRGLAYLELGHVRGAREDLGRYLQLLPEAEDADAVREALVMLAGQPARLN